MQITSPGLRIPGRQAVNRMLALVGAVALALGLMAAAAPASLAQSPEQGQGSDYQLGTGDRVKVTVFGHTDLSGEFEIDGTGHISMPLIKNVEAANGTSRDLEQRITDLLSPDYLRNPQVSVEVLTYRPFYILGEIKQPGSYPYVNGMTVWNAVALAGGFTYRARTGYVVMRRNGQEQRVDLDSPVQPGDVIEVAERFF